MGFRAFHRSSSFDEAVNIDLGSGANDALTIGVADDLTRCATFLGAATFNGGGGINDSRMIANALFKIIDQPTLLSFEV